MRTHPTAHFPLDVSGDKAPSEKWLARTSILVIAAASVAGWVAIAAAVGTML